MSQYEPVEMTAKRFSYFPRRFVWRGQTIEVEAVVRVWSERRGQLLNRQYFDARCADGHERTLYQDLRDSTWHVNIDNG